MNKYIIDKNGYIRVFINDILSLFLHLLSYHCSNSGYLWEDR